MQSIAMEMINPFQSALGSRRIVPNTGDKTQFSDLVHCKYIVRTWTMYLPNTRPVHHRYIQNFPSQFPSSFPGAANAQYIHSVPGCVIKMS